MAFIPTQARLPYKQLAARVLAVLFFLLIFFVMGMYFGGRDQLKQDQVVIDRLKQVVQGSTDASKTAPYTPISQRDLGQVLKRDGLIDNELAAGDLEHEYLSLERDQDAVVLLLPAQRGVVVYRLWQGDPQLVFALSGDDFSVTIPEKSDGKSFELQRRSSGQTTLYSWNGQAFIDQSTRLSA